MSDYYLRQDLQQLVVRQEVEAGEGHPLLLQVVLKIIRNLETMHD